MPRRRHLVQGLSQVTGHLVQGLSQVEHEDWAVSSIQRAGRELVVASLNGGPVGTFTTAYRFESKWDPDAATGVEVKGRCQHPIVTGSGTGGLAGAEGRLDFNDQVETGLFFYRGHINLG